MRGYGQLAWRYLRQQRRRSILTVFGIMLSVALISALGTMGQSIVDNFLDHSIRENGSYHIAFPQGSAELYDRLRHHALVDKLGAMRTGEPVQLDEHYRIRVNEASEHMFGLAPLWVEEGRPPAGPDEIVVEAWALPRLPGNPELGDRVELPAPDGTGRTYTVTGLLPNRWSSQTQGLIEVYALWTAPGTLPAQDIYLTFKPGVDISKQLDAFRQMADNMTINREVLALMGEHPDDRINVAIRTVFGTLIGLVVISTVAVIYNAFHIAVLERIRQFGLLRTIGATPGQIRHLVFREGTILCLIGIPLGLAAGWGAMWLVLDLMTRAGFTILYIEDFRLRFHGWIMGGSALLGLVSVYAAAWLPAWRASRVPPVEAARGTVGLVRETYRRSRLPSPLQVAGIAGKMAAKNIRRNRVKFRITTFSVAVSVALFIVFHYFAQQAFRLTVDTNEQGNIAFAIRQNVSTGDRPGSSGDFVSPEAIRRIAAIPGVAGVYGSYGSLWVRVLVPEEKLNPEFREKSGIQLVQDPQDPSAVHAINAAYERSWPDGSIRYAVSTVIELYDEARLRAAAGYLESGTADPAALDDDGVLLVQTVNPFVQQTKRKEIMKLSFFRPGDTIAIDFAQDVQDVPADAAGPASHPAPEPPTGPEPADGPAPVGPASPGRSGNERVKPDQGGTIRELKVAGVLKEAPFGTPYQPYQLVVIMTPQTYARLVAGLPEAHRVPDVGNRHGLDIALEDGVNVSAVRQALEAAMADIPGGLLIDIALEQQRQRQFNLQMQVFIYGFLTVIGLIGSLNIINTVQTNLLLRRREFAMLQAIGMTPGQLRRMATLEGVWFGVIGGCWGLVAGMLISYFLYGKMSVTQSVPFAFPWTGAAIACGFMLLVGLLAVQGPMRRMGRINLTEELRQEA